MHHLTGSQKKYLRGLAHNKKPVVQIGQKQLTQQVHKEILRALDRHELIKVKCIDQKERGNKKEIGEMISQRADCELVGMIGHILIFFKQQQDPEKRKIKLPSPPLQPRIESAHPSHKDSAQ